MSELTGRVAVVTGGAGPLGSVLSAALATAGARVVVVDRAGAHDAAAALPVGDSAHVAIEADLLDSADLDRVVQDVHELGGCDVLVNNAAFTGTSGVPGYAVPFEEQTDAAFSMALHLNLAVPFSLSRRLAPLLQAGGHGSIINIASIYGLVGPNLGLYEGTRMGNPAAYAASKGGLIQLTRYLATVLAPQARCNAVAPGGIFRDQSAQFVTRYEALTPMGRMAREDDLSGVLSWLASDRSAYVTGQVIAVDGGWTAW